MIRPAWILPCSGRRLNSIDPPEEVRSAGAVMGGWPRGWRSRHPACPGPHLLDPHHLGPSACSRRLPRSGCRWAPPQGALPRSPSRKACNKQVGTSALSLTTCPAMKPWSWPPISSECLGIRPGFWCSEAPAPLPAGSAGRDANPPFQQLPGMQIAGYKPVNRGSPCPAMPPAQVPRQLLLSMQQEGH